MFLHILAPFFLTRYSHGCIPALDCSVTIYMYILYFQLAIATTLNLILFKFISINLS